MYKKFIYQILFVMRLTIVVLILGMMQVSAIGFAQKVNYVKKQASLEEIFEVIRVQTGYNVFYSSNKIDDSKKLDVRFKDTELKAVLDLCAEKHSLAYNIEAQNIFFKPKEKNIVEKIISLFSEIDVRGKVVDEKGAPLQGATVKVKNSSLGTTTDKGGEFFLKGVPEDAVIVIAYLGYKPLELKASVGMGVIKMELATSELDEVTVSTGYWSTSKRLSTGNITKITATEIESQPVTSPLLALQGRVAGLEISMPGSAAPGAAPKIRIRGNNSLRMSGNGKMNGVGQQDDGNYPLYIVDGVPIISSPIQGSGNSSDLIFGGYDPISTINPSNIESIEILKDGDATAIYGSRGANGVILITTKQNNKDNERTKVDLSIYKGVGQVSKKLELLNTEQYLAMRKEALLNENLSPSISDPDLLFWDQTRYTDWQDVLLGGTASITDAQTNVSSGNQNTSFRIGAGFHKETLVFPGDFGYYRISGQIGIDHISTNKQLKVAVTANYGVDNNSLFNGDIMNKALALPPNAPKLYNEDGSLNWEMHTIQGTLQPTWVNPFASFQNTQKVNSRNLITNGNISYEIIEGLVLGTSIGYSDLSSNEKLKFPLISSPPNSNLEGTANFYDNRRSSWIVEPKLTYSKKNKDHDLDLLVGMTLQQNTNEFLWIVGDGYRSDALLNSLSGAGRIQIQTDNTGLYKYTSFYGRIGYNWKEKYLLNITGRRDGSSRFGPERRFGNFGAISAGWIISEEPLIQKYFPFLSFGKLRSSYGITGSDAAGGLTYYNVYDMLPDRHDGMAGVIPSALYNPDFGWETTRKLEIGFEAGFANNRLGLELSWYRNRSSDQLVNYSMPSTTGFPSVLSNFDATVQNTGWETVFRAQPITSRRWRWNISINMSVPRNKLLQFDGIESSPYINQYKVGEPLSIQWLYNWSGIDQLTGIHSFVDENKDGIISDLDRTLMNPTDPSFYGGIYNTFQYKSFELSVQFQFSRKDGSRYMPTMPGLQGNQSIEVLNRWFAPGDKTDIQRFAVIPPSVNYPENYRAYNNARLSNYNIQDASFMRMKTMSLNYSLPTNFLQKIKMQQVKFFIQGQNLFTLAGYKGLDPETGSGMPPLKMFTAGIQARL